MRRRTIVMTMRPLVALVLFLVVVCSAPAQDGGKTRRGPLSEATLLKLTRADIEDEVIVALVKKRGVSFPVDGAALKRLRDGGVSESVLASLRPAGDAKPDADGDQPLATARQDDGLIVEVLEARVTKNETFLIRWRYRNPTGGPIELIAETLPIVALTAPPNTAVKFWKSVYYMEGKFRTDKAYNRYILVEKAVAGKYVPCAKKLGGKEVVIRPGKEYELWAEFPPPLKTEKTISLHLMRTALIRNIPIQSPEK
jgi:hypothetical protein